ncbi:tetratricopeptide repeat protein [Kaistia dalseonensis]|uniref:Adenylate cyclase n=1 Tax=Kaistia dalseonensis TaxID=410840 RepID=A0ABU0HA00_9HYPH|nr:tetratricopeptide repeat protein [Kaistia dalseonensis]MCX5496525.1 tetratricopeptide repeat protein [Kaistia dalseonensis]MDQ0439147.1 adenylate cyclase [Kaistia dalseonensis]
MIAALDVVGYSELIRADELGTLREIRLVYKTIVRPTLAKYGAHIIKTMGDGGLVEFPSVLDAVEWTMGFQTTMAERNANSSRPPIEVRAAIVLADVILSEDDRFGVALGFAMRLQTAAPPGGIAITHSVRWQLLGEPASAFKPVGFLMLRSVPYPVEAWFWAPPGKTLPDAQPTQNQMLTPGVLALPGLAAEKQPDQRPLVVVLPFEDLSHGKDCETFADGAVEETTATLARLRDIRVIARNSAFLYKGKPTDVRALKRDLGVRYVIEGSVRRGGDTLRVTAQLIDAETGAHLWSGRVDGSIQDQFTLQDNVATQIAGALHPAIRTAEIERSRRKEADAVRAHDLVLRAMPHFWAHRRSENEIALKLLDEALASDPRSGTALGLKAWSLSQQVTYLWSDDIERDKKVALALAEKAAETSEPDPLVYTMIGATFSILNADQSRARVFIERALSLDSTFAWAWTRMGYVHAYSGEPERGIECLNKAISLSPGDPVQFNAFAGMATCHFMLGSYRDATQWARKALDERPGMIWANRLLATSAALCGDLAQARKAVERLLLDIPGMTLADVRAAVHNLTGKDFDRYLEGLRLAGLPEG